MNERLIRTVGLKNGLGLEIIDCSQNIAGDRWQVVLTIRIKIPVNMLSSYNDIQTALRSGEILSSLGESVCFEQRRERNFIAAKDKDRVLNNLIESYFSSSLDYVSNPDFPKRYILHQNREYLKKTSWYPNETK